MSPRRPRSLRLMVNERRQTVVVKHWNTIFFLNIILIRVYNEFLCYNEEKPFILWMHVTENDHVKSSLVQPTVLLLIFLLLCHNYMYNVAHICTLSAGHSWHTRWIDERKPQIWSTPYSSQTTYGCLFFAFTWLQLFWFVLIGNSLERNTNSLGYLSDVQGAACASVKGQVKLRRRRNNTMPSSQDRSSRLIETWRCAKWPRATMRLFIPLCEGWPRKMW